MTTEEKNDVTTVRAAGVITNDMLWKAITFGGTIAALPGPAAGVCRSTAQVAGQGVSVVYQGITKVKAGAAINSLGAPLTITTSGWFTAAASGFVSIGRAMETCNSGDLLKAYVDFLTLPQWAGN